MMLLIVCPIAHIALSYAFNYSFLNKQMLNSSERAVTFSNGFFFFSCNNLGNKAKDSVGTGEIYFF